MPTRTAMTRTIRAPATMAISLSRRPIASSSGDDQVRPAHADHAPSALCARAARRARASRRPAPNEGCIRSERAHRTVGLWLARVPVHGELNEARRAVEAQLLLDPLAVRFHRLDAQAQIPRDLARRLAASDQVQHLDLAIAQPFDGVHRVLAA